MERIYGSNRDFDHQSIGSAGRTVPEILGPHRFRIGQTEILLYYGEPSPYSISQEIYIDLLPVESYLTEGIWRIVLSAGKIMTGQYEMWLPSDNVLNRGTGFLFPTDATTLTIPSSASRAISVGAYDARTFAYADFREEDLPDLQIW